MFKTRLLSGIVLVAVALLTIISGGYVLFFTLLGISLIGMQELYKAMKVRTDSFNALEIAGYLAAVIYYILMMIDFEKYGMMGVILAFMIFMFVYVFTYPRFNAEQVMPAFFGVVYVAVMLSFIYLTRNLTDGKFLVWLIFRSLRLSGLRHGPECFRHRFATVLVSSATWNIIRWRNFARLFCSRHRYWMWKFRVF